MSGTTSITSSSTSGQFHVSNGQIISPSGGTFTAKGIAVYDNQMGDASQILADFPGINFVRLAVYSYQPPSAYSAFIQQMTSAGVVVEVEDHTTSTGSDSGGGTGSAFSGSQLSNELNWYSSMASAYASNSNVWFGTDNEPPAGGLSTWEQETYNAIRSTGNNNPIMMELPGGGYTSGNASSYGMDPSVYSSMSNIVIDAHYYGWDANFSTDQQTVNSALTNLVQGAQSITSANGTIPVIIGEYGTSTNGVSTDANASQVEQAVQQSTVTSGSVAWAWNAGAASNLTDGSGNLTSYGQEVAQWMASSGGSSSTSSSAAVSNTAAPNTNASSAPGASGTTPSANDTVVLAGSTGAITDASGNTWTITSGGQVAEDGTTDTSTAGVAELAYVNGTIWQENTNNLWWGKTSPTASWAFGTGLGTSPLPGAVTIPSNSDNATVSQSQISVVTSSGNNMVFVSGSADIVNLSAGTNTVSDTGSANTYILPSAANGAANFTTDILNSGDTLDFSSALAATDWNGTAATLPNYLMVNDTSSGAVISIAPTSGGTATAIATIAGETNLNLNTLLTHSIT